MEANTRRTFLQHLGAMGAAFGAIIARAQTLGAQAPPENTPFRRALTTVRAVNTLQARHWKETGRYVPLAELLAMSSTAEFVSVLSNKLGWMPFDPSTAAATGVFVEGYQMQFHVDYDRASYTLLFTDVAAQRGFKTDQNGVILDGRVEGIQAAFVGLPIQMPKTNVRRSFAAQVVGFFFPVVYADNPCCRQICGGFCIQSGPACNSSCGPAFCCNLGYFACTWCCTWNVGCELCTYC